MAEKQSLDSIQILRGIAALAVVFHHACGTVAENAPHPAWLNQIGRLPEFGAAGVDIFFIISGFIMVYVSRDAFGRSGAAQLFWRKRLIRIFPLYWLYTTLMLLLVLSPFAMQHAVFSLSYTIKSYLLIPAFNPGSALTLPQPLLQVGWTLSYELLFYFIFGTWLYLGKIKTLVPFVLGCFILAFASSPVLPPGSPLGAFLGQPILFEFLYGVIVGVVFLQGWRVQSTAALACVLIAAGAFAISIFVHPELPMRWLFWGLPAALLVYGSLGLQPRANWLNSTLLALGDASYTLYLQHAFITLAIGGLLKRSIIVHRIQPDLLIAMIVAGCALLAWFSYKYLELPMNTWLAQRFIGPRRAVISPAADSYTVLPESGI